MKKLFLLSALLVSSSCIFAQQPELADKVATLEAKVATLETAVNAMQQKVAEVTAQNLALKQAISLKPIIAEATSKRGINYRLIEAKGNKQTGEMTFVISVVNNTKQDYRMGYNDPMLVDEKGYNYASYDRWKEKSIGNEGFFKDAKLLPDTPIIMRLVVVADNEPQYAKVLTIEPDEIWSKDGFRFTNIPIKWE